MGLKELLELEDNEEIFHITENSTQFACLIKNTFGKYRLYKVFKDQQEWIRMQDYLTAEEAISLLMDLAFSDEDFENDSED